MIKIKSRPLILIFSTQAFVLLSTAAQSSGFKINEYSASALGAANSSGAVHVGDASTVFSNPAGMSQLEQSQVFVGGSAIFINGEFDNQGSVDALGNPIDGGDGGNIAPNLFVPNFYYAQRVDDKLSFGLGITAPFGLTTDYDDTFVGRYSARLSELVSIDLNPSVAYRFNDALSLGFGVSASLADITLSNAIDFGAVCFASAGPAFCSANGYAPQQNDGEVVLSGDDWGYGYNLGLLFSPNSQFSVGLTYRSKIKYDLSGEADFTVPDSVTQGLLPALGGAFTDTEIASTLTQPETLAISASYQLNPRWKIQADLNQTQWSRFETLEVDFANPAQANLVEAENWDNSIRAAFGLEYQYNEAWTFRGGLAYDETPIPDNFRRARIPGSDRNIFAAGFSWHAADNWSLDAAYNFLSADTAKVDVEGSYNETLRGEYPETNVHILSVALRWRFD